jgi:hypothetical protein
MVCRNVHDDPPTDGERDQDLEREFQEIEREEAEELPEDGNTHHYIRREADRREEIADDQDEFEVGGEG